MPIEPSRSSKSTTESTFGCLFGLGTAIFLFGALFALTKHRNRVPDLLIFVTAAALFGAALLRGHLPRRTSAAAPEWRSGPISTTILLIELAFCASYIKDVIHELLWP
jgi:hypothetical protein